VAISAEAVAVYVLFFWVSRSPGSRHPAEMGRSSACLPQAGCAPTFSGALDQRHHLGRVALADDFDFGEAGFDAFQVALA